MSFLKKVSLGFGSFLFSLNLFPSDKQVVPLRFGPFYLQAATSGGSFSGYLGADSSNNASLIGSTAVIFFSFSKNVDTEIEGFTTTSMVNEKAYVNFFRPDPKNSENSVQPNQDDLKNNPIYGKSIAYMSFMDGPVVVLGSDTVDPILGNSQKICLIESQGSVRTNITKLNDAAANACSKIAAIANSSSVIFAAVAPKDYSFGTAGSAISLLYKGADYLRIANAVTGEKSGNNPVALDLTAIGIGQLALLGDIVSMYWDSSSSTLFVTLKTNRTTAGIAGGAVSVLVGSIDSSDKSKPYKFSLQPIVATNSSYFVTNGDQEIIGFYDNTANNVGSAIYKVRTLTTSTNNSYLIVNGGNTTAVDLAKNKVYALPIVGGKLASKNDFTKEVSSSSEMTLNTDLAAKVGGGVLPSAADADIKDMFVVGDSVFVCLASSNYTTDEPAKQGIFYSAAIFDEAGRVVSWSPWMRCMGSTDKTLGGAIDVASGNVFYLSINTSLANYMNVTRWGSGSKDGLLGGTSSDYSVGLSSILAYEFQQTRSGVHQIFNFDENITTFKNGDDSLSMMVACGYKKVVLIESGQQVGAGSFLSNSGDFKTNLLRSTNGYAAAGNVASKVMVISGGVVDTLGPISKVEVSRCAKAVGQYKGWMFISGYNGVAVLSEDNGNGWTTDDTTGGLKYGFVGLNSTMSFKKLGDFSKVRTVVCDDTNLYILTVDSLYKVALAAANFSAAGAAAPTATLIANASTLTGVASATFNDLVVSSKVAILATSEGLFRSGNSKNIKTGADWAFVEIKLPYISMQAPHTTWDFSFKSSKQLFPVSIKKGGFEQGGNIYLLNCDYCENLADIYRFYVKDTSNASVDDETVQRVVEAGSYLPFFSLGNYRANIFTDGALFYHQLSQNFGNRDFVKVAKNMKDMTNYGYTRGTNIDLKVDSTAYNVGLMLRNNASGALIVPGDFGISVNE